MVGRKSSGFTGFDRRGEKCPHRAISGQRFLINVPQHHTDVTAHDGLVPLIR